MVLKTDPRVAKIFDKYPTSVREKMVFLRKLIVQTAEETTDILTLEETLRWGEPSYITKEGSTLRIDWKAKTPDQYAMYFQCTSRLVETFRMVFDQTFQYEGNRAIIFPMDQSIPIMPVKECVRATLTYHKVKHLATLGI